MSSGASFIPGYKPMARSGWTDEPTPRAQQLNWLSVRVCSCGHTRGDHIVLVGCCAAGVAQCSCKGFEAREAVEREEPPRDEERGTPALPRGLALASDRGRFGHRRSRG